MRAPVPVALAGTAEDQIEIPGGEAGLAHGIGDPPGRVGHVAAPEAGQRAGLGGLEPEGNPGHAGPAVGTEVRLVGIFGVALDRDLGAGGTGNGLEDGAQELGVQARRGAPAEEHAGRRRQRPGGGQTRQLGDTRPRVSLHQVVAVGVGGEGAVVAALPAERHVHVDAEGCRGIGRLGAG